MQFPRYPSEPLFSIACLLAIAFWLAAILQFASGRDRVQWSRVCLHVLNGCSLAAVALLVLRPGTLVLQKQLTHLAMPLGLVWLGLWVASVACWTRSRWVAGTWSLLLAAIITVAGNGHFCNWLMARVEAPHLDLDPMATLAAEADRPLDVVVALGGSTGRSPADGLQVNFAGDRVVLAARIYHAGFTPQLVCTGMGDPEVLGPERHPAAEARQLLIGLGVPAAAISQLGGVNTKEEIAQVAAAAEQRQWKRIGLVTSAFHMPRAQRLAAAVGLEIVPLPAGFISQPNADKPFRVTPEARSLSSTSIALKELLAQLVGR